MKNKKRRNVKTFLVITILTIMLISLVSAVGISTDYHDKNPVKLAPGETRDIIFGRLQNTEEEDISIKIELMAGSEIATITNQNLDSFVVPAGTRNIEINLRVSAPEEAVEGTESKITIKYTELTSSEGEGMIGFTESKTISIPVLIQTPEKPKISAALWIITLVVIILVILIILTAYLIIKKKK